MDQFNPNDILNQQLGEEEAAFDNGFRQQESALRAHFQGFIDRMQQQYQVERKYLEQTPMDFEQRNARVLDLNKKYEMQALKLQQQAEPHFLELQQKQLAAKTKLDMRRQQGAQRLQLVQDLLSSGYIPEQNRAQVMQEQLQAVGLNVPLSLLRPPRRTVQDVQADLRGVEAALGQFEPGRDRKWRKDIPIGFKTMNEFGEIAVEEADAEQKQRYGLLVNARDELHRELAGVVTGANRLSNAMMTAGGAQGNPLAQKLAAKVAPTTKPKQSNDPLGLGL